MDKFGNLAPKFVKFLSRKDVQLNELRLSAPFCNTFVQRLEQRFYLKLRTGYLLPVKFKSRRMLLKGFSVLYTQFGLKGGELLVFEYLGGLNLNLYILGADLCEIQYPYVIHPLQTCNPLRVTLRAGGLKFAKFVDPDEEIVDEIDPPIPFLDRCANKFGFYIRFVLSNGKKFIGRYNRDTLKISGFRSMCEILGIPNLNSFHMLLFTFDGDVLFNISAFDSQMVEIVFPGSPISSGLNGDDVAVHSRFEITVQNFHMEKYCYGVDISVDYRNLTQTWEKNDYIVAYYGNRSWKLEVKKRSNGKRTAIHEGWIQFRKDLGLQTGDVCIFECPLDSLRHFAVQVIKNPTPNRNVAV